MAESTIIIKLLALEKCSQSSTQGQRTDLYKVVNVSSQTKMYFWYKVCVLTNKVM